MASASRQFYLFLSRTAGSTPATRTCTPNANNSLLRPSRTAISSRPFSSFQPHRAEDDSNKSSPTSASSPESSSTPASSAEPSSAPAPSAAAIPSPATTTTTPRSQPPRKQRMRIFSEAHLGDQPLETPTVPFTAADFDEFERAHFESLTKKQQTSHLNVVNHLKAVAERPREPISEEEADMFAKAFDRENEDVDFRDEPLQKKEIGFWAEDEDDEFGMVPDDDDTLPQDGTAMTSIALNELELHREIREYTRIAAWELPLLEKFTKPFSPPTKSQPLRFRYTTYMGETHPAASKVALEFTTRDLSSACTPPLTAAQRTKLTKLLGVRYNPETDIAKFSCEKFGEAAQNKRYLGELVQKLVKEARDKRDMFEDVPLDVRHVVAREGKKGEVKMGRVKMPDHWGVRDQQSAERLVEERREKEDGLEGGEVDGKSVLRQYVYASLGSGKLAGRIA